MSLPAAAPRRVTLRRVHRLDRQHLPEEVPAGAASDSRAIHPIKTMHPFDERIRSLLSAHGRLNLDPTQLPPDADLYQAGMTSHASVNLMVALEGEFETEFPDNMLNRSVFSSIVAIRGALVELGAV